MQRNCTKRCDADLLDVYFTPYVRYGFGLQIKNNCNYSGPQQEILPMYNNEEAINTF